MTRLALLFSLLFLSSASGKQIENPTEPIFISQETELHKVGSSMTAVEQKVRGAAVRILNGELGGHGSGSVIKYKGLTLVLTAQHVASGEPGSVYYAVKNNDLERARAVNDLIYPLAQAFYKAPFLDMHNRMKACLNLLGRIDSTTVRPPLMPLSNAEINELKSALIASGLLAED